MHSTNKNKTIMLLNRWRIRVLFEELLEDPGKDLRTEVPELLNNTEIYLILHLSKKMLSYMHTLSIETEKEERGGKGNNKKRAGLECSLISISCLCIASL